MEVFFITSIFPLIVFTLVKKFSNLRAGVISSIFIAFLMLSLRWWLQGFFDEQMAIILFSLSILGFFSIRTKNDLFFKLQPAIYSLIIVCALMWLHFLRTPFTLQLFDSVGMLLVPEYTEVLNSDLGQAFLIRLSYYAMIFLGLHAILLCHLAFRRGVWLWLIAKVLLMPYFILSVVGAEYLFESLS